MTIRITHKIIPWGGIKAVTADIEGDGRDEIVFCGYESDLREELDVYARTTPYRQSTWYTALACYYIKPVLGLVRLDTDGKLKPSSDYVWKGSTIFTRTFERGNASYDDLLNGTNPFKIQEYMLAPVGQNSEVFPFTEREMSVAAGPLFGQTGIAKERDDAAVRLYGGKMLILKSNGSTLQEAASVNATGTSALIAGDFAGEGVELGNPVRVVNRNDRSYTAVLQGIPYHVDTIAPDGKSVMPEPVNFSYTKGSKAEYSASSSESENNNTKFNMTSSVETIFALDSDITRNIAGGMASLPSMERTIKIPTNKIYYVNKKYSRNGI